MIRNLISSRRSRAYGGLARIVFALGLGLCGLGRPAGAAEPAGTAEPANTATPASTAGPGSTARPVSLEASFGSGGFTLRTSDGDDVLHFRGNVSTDGRYFVGAANSNADTWLIRRLRPTLEGTLDGRFDFRVMPDFALGKAILQDAWVTGRIEPWLNLTVGKFKAPVGLERLQLEQFARFIEPALTADLLPYRDIGAKLSMSLAQGRATWDIAMLNGTLDGGSSEGNSTPDANATGKFTWESRLFVRPFAAGSTAPGGLGFGVAATYVTAKGVAGSGNAGTLLASYKSTGQQPLFGYRAASIANGVELRVVPQVFYAHRTFSLLGEYVHEEQRAQHLASSTAGGSGGGEIQSLRHQAWQVQAAWYLTGEAEAYDATPRKQDFRAGGPGKGAWELVARWHAITFDSAAFAGGVSSLADPASAVRSAHAGGAGLNWYLDANLKVQFDYELTRFSGGAALGSRPNERVATVQFALIF